MISRGNRHRAKPRSAPPLSSLILVGVVLLVAAMVVVTRATDGENAASTGPSGEASSRGGGPTRGDVTGAKPGDESRSGDLAPSEMACKSQVVRVARVLEAARLGVHHMRTHVRAHDRWAAGQISDDVKSSTYKRTRLAGPDDLAEYDRARTAMGKDLSGCDRQQTACARRMIAMKPALAGARSGMEHWRTHLQNMAAFDQGAFGAARAQRLWTGTIQGNDEATQPFRRAMKALASAPACRTEAG